MKYEDLLKAFKAAKEKNEKEGTPAQEDKKEALPVEENDETPIEDKDKAPVEGKEEAPVEGEEEVPAEEGEGEIPVEGEEGIAEEDDVIPGEGEDEEGQPVQEGDVELPEELQFLADPEFQKEIEQIQGSPEKIKAAAQVLGQEIGPENVDKKAVGVLVEGMKATGLLEGEEEGVAPEGEVAPGEQPVDENGEPVEQPVDENGEPVEQPVDENGEPVEQPVDENGNPIEQIAEGAEQLAESGQQIDPKQERILRRALKVIEALLHID